MADTLILRKDIREPVLALNTEECGELFKALLNYAWCGEQPQELPRGADIAFMFIRTQIDKDVDKVERANRARRENGKKGGRPRKQKEPPEEKKQAF